MIAYQSLLVIKFVAVFLFVGGAIAALASKDTDTRKRALHRISSPGLLLTWLTGYALIVLNQWPLFELWVTVSVVLSIIAHGLLSFCVVHRRHDAGAIVWTSLPIFIIIVLMVFQPTWRAVTG